VSPPYDQVDEGANASWFQALRNSDVTAAGGRSASRLRGLSTAAA
jgi:hypothetical protein